MVFIYLFIEWCKNPSLVAKIIISFYKLILCDVAETAMLSSNPFLTHVDSPNTWIMLLLLKNVFINPFSTFTTYVSIYVK